MINVLMVKLELNVIPPVLGLIQNLLQMELQLLPKKNVIVKPVNSVLIVQNLVLKLNTKHHLQTVKTVIAQMVISDLLLMVIV